MFVFVCQEEKDQQWKQAMDYLSAVTELNYMTQIVIMLYEDNNKVRAALLHTLFLSALPLQFHVLISLCLCLSVWCRTRPLRSGFM